MQIREILTLKSADIHSIAPTDTVESAVAKLVDLGVGSLVVLKNGEMVGLLTERDVLHGMAKRGCDLKDAEVSTLMVTVPVVASADDSVKICRDRPLPLKAEQMTEEKRKMKGESRPVLGSGPRAS